MKLERVDAVLAVLVVVSHNATACHGDESDPCVVAVCDISRSACQREVFDAIACARDFDGPSPPVEEITLSEFQARNQAPAPTVREQQIANVFVTLGFAPTIGSVTQTHGSPIAYYSSEVGRVTIVESNDDDEIRTFTLLQAFANAQQDVDYDLQQLFGEAAESFDASLAMNATVYGESFFSAAIAWENSFGTDGSFPRRAVTDMEDIAREFAADPAVAFPSVNGAFALGHGGRLYASRWRPQHGHRAEIAALFSRPPKTTLAVMSNELPGLPLEEVPDPVLDIEAPHEVVAVDTLGAWMATTFMLRASGSRMLSRWRGDRITVVGGETSGDVGIHWRIEWDAFSEYLEQQIREASASRPWFVHVDDGTLVIVAAFEPSSLDTWVERFGLMP